MSGKLKELAGESSDNSQLIAGIRDSANQIWLAGLGAFAKAQKEGTKFFNGLVEEGEGVQKQAKKAACEAYDDVKARASKSWDNCPGPRSNACSRTASPKCFTPSAFRPGKISTRFLIASPS